MITLGKITKANTTQHTISHYTPKTLEKVQDLCYTLADSLPFLCVFSHVPGLTEQSKLYNCVY